MFDFMPPFNFNTHNEAKTFITVNSTVSSAYFLKAKRSSAIAHKIPTRYVPIASTERRKPQGPGKNTQRQAYSREWMLSVTSVETKWTDETVTGAER
jgi:hypothetical protein